MASLYVVATPIGNLGDLSLRAIEILEQVDMIAAEDTRNTKVLCDKYNIKTRLISYHKYSENKRIELFLNFLKEGKSIALVTDAGTPLISDPGAVLVENVRKKGFSIIPIPGASAVITFLSAIQRNGESFKFIGFFPKSEKQAEDILLENRNENLVFYESPKRLIKTLEIIKEFNPNATVATGRELTKKFEEINQGNIEDILNHYLQKTEIKGEIVCMISASKGDEVKDLNEKISKLKKQGFKDKEISIILSSIFDVKKNDIYKICTKIS